MKITVAGVGYVGLSNAILLAQRHTVTAYDISKERLQMIAAKTVVSKVIVLSSV